jgi:hypothetical protein
MKYPSVYESDVLDSIFERLDKLSATTVPQWGKMNAGQMLAHLNISYDITYGKMTVKNNFLMKMMLKIFVKPTVVGDKPYQKNSRTAPYFIIANDRDFEVEKSKLVAYMKQMQKEGATKFEGKESPSFGAMTAQEWSNQYYKHLEHHFTQFGI